MSPCSGGQRPIDSRVPCERDHRRIARNQPSLHRPPLRLRPQPACLWLPGHRRGSARRMASVGREPSRRRLLGSAHHTHCAGARGSAGLNGRDDPIATGSTSQLRAMGIRRPRKLVRSRVALLARSGRRESERKDRCFFGARDTRGAARAVRAVGAPSADHGRRHADHVPRPAKCVKAPLDRRHRPLSSSTTRL